MLTGAPPMLKVPTLFAALSFLFAVSPASASTCDSDAECPGSELCQAGACVLPEAGSSVRSSNEHSLERAGTFLLGAERLFGISFTTSSAETRDGSIEVEDSRTHIGLLLSNGGVYAIPRVGLDYGVGAGFTLGGSLGYASSDGKTETKLETRATGATSTTEHGPETSALLFAPRVGWLSVSGRIGVWLRGGITYWSTESEQDLSGGGKVTTSANGVALSVDPTLLILPIDHVALTVSVTLDAPLSGTTKTERREPAPSGPPYGQAPEVTTSELETKLLAYGAMTGLLVWF